MSIGAGIAIAAAFIATAVAYTVSPGSPEIFVAPAFAAWVIAGFGS